MKVVYPHLICRNKRGRKYYRKYCRWEVQIGAESIGYHVLMDSIEWHRILEMADKYLALKEIVERLYREKKYAYEFLREWLTEELRHLDRLAREYEDRGLGREAELVRFRIKVYAEELKHRREEIEKLEKVLKEFKLL